MEFSVSSDAGLFGHDNVVVETNHAHDGYRNLLVAVSSYSESQQRVLSVLQRISGGISVLGGLYILVRATRRRHLGFHRIMMGLSIQTILWGAYHLWGTAAVPEGTPDVYGASGTTTTCTVQGFLFQTSMVIPFYYVFLSLYSWVVILHGNFDPSKYEWIEKYIHMVVHIVPLASAVYLLKVQSFNANGLHCWIASVPEGCGGEIECTRGPQNPTTMMWVFGGLPSIFCLVFPTIVMVALTYCVYLRQKRTRQRNVQSLLQISPALVARQSAVYLGILYWVYLPLFVYAGVTHSGATSSSVSYGVALWVSIVSVSLGLWMAIVYWYFTAEDQTLDQSLTNLGKGDGNNVDATETGQVPSSNDDREDLDDIPEASENNNNHDEETGNDRRKKIIVRTKSRRSQRWSIKASDNSFRRSSFNIFDGSRCSGQFSDFIFDGDSDDEEKDLAESKQWEYCQTMNNDE